MIWLFSFITLASASLLHTGDHCVAYKAEKKMFLIRNVTVIGKNCDVSAQVIPQVDGRFAIEMSVPTNNFRSGEPERDKDVAKTLKADVESNIIFRSNPMTADEWKEKIKGGEFPLKGELEIGNEMFPVEAQVQIAKVESNFEADGVIKTKFKDFKIDPPKLVGGIMANVKQDLELHFHIQGQKTLGLDSITP